MLKRDHLFLRLLVHTAALAPLVLLILNYLRGALGANPIQAATQRTGQTAVILLLATLACTPLNLYLGWRWASLRRRALGLYTFLYAAIHFILFVAIDYSFDWSFIWQEIISKPYLILGVCAFLLLNLLAVTSFKIWMRRLGVYWKRLHRLIYLIGLLVVMHYSLAVKGSLFTLQGNVKGPLWAVIVLALLLVARLPAVRRAFKKQSRNPKN